LKVLSYNMPKHYVEPVESEPWDMESVDIATVLPIQGTQEQKRKLRECGKLILHTVYANTMLDEDGVLRKAMIAASRGECDGVSLDEIYLGTLTPERFARVKQALKKFRSRCHGKLIHVWVTNAMSQIDHDTVSMLYRFCDMVSPELYRSEEGRLDFEDFVERYDMGPAKLQKTLMGIVTHTDPRWRKSDVGWLPNMQRQIAEIRRLRLGGVAMWAPMHLKNSEERRALDAVIQGV